jgi:diguanylate cyclase (GGDEF)-like protein
MHEKLHDSTRHVAPFASPDPKITRALENEQTLNSLLRTVVQRKSLPEILVECLDILLSVSWLSILPKGGVFLVEEEPDTLTLVAERDLSPELLALCARVPFGRCLCGKAAATRRLIHTRCVDERHEIRFEGMQAHGHYNVPILDGGNVVGVMVLYLPHGHHGEDGEAEFLKAVADILSLVVRQKRVEQDLKEAVRKLRRQAYVDSLTELYNRRFLMERLSEEVDEAHRYERPLSVLILDVDRFKSINDTYGHSIGDKVLHTIGRHMVATTRSYDIAARFGGEEFCLVLPNTDAATAAGIAERMRRLIESDEIRTDREHTVKVTVSIGVAGLEATESLDRLLARADGALYRAKEGGRNRTEYAEGIQLEALPTAV